MSATKITTNYVYYTSSGRREEGYPAQFMSPPTDMYVGVDIDKLMTILRRSPAA